MFSLQTQTVRRNAPHKNAHSCFVCQLPSSPTHPRQMHPNSCTRIQCNKQSQHQHQQQQQLRQDAEIMSKRSVVVDDDDGGGAGARWVEAVIRMVMPLGFQCN